MLITVFMWQDHSYLMRRKELATELEQQGITASRMTALEIQDFMSGFPKMVVPNNHGFPTKHDHFGVLWGYHHLRKHPCVAMERRF